MTKGRVSGLFLPLAGIVVGFVLLHHRMPGKASGSNPSSVEMRQPSSIEVRQIRAAVWRYQRGWFRFSITDGRMYGPWWMLHAACARVRCLGVQEIPQTPYQFPGPRVAFFRYALVHATDPFDRKKEWRYDARLLAGGIWQVYGVSYERSITCGAQRTPDSRFCCMLDVSGSAPLTPVVMADYEHKVVLSKMGARFHAQESGARVRHW